MLNSAELSKRFPSLKRLLIGNNSRRIPVARQLSATDCGAAALRMVLAYHGKDVALDELRTALGIGRDGATSAALLRVGASYGLRGRGVHATVQDLEHIARGTILYWQFRHFIVFERTAREKVYVVDPAFGRRAIPKTEFRRGFTGVALLFEPQDTFQSGTAGSTNAKALAGLFAGILEQKDLLVRLLTASFVSQILSLVMPFLTAVLIDRVIPNRDYSLLGIAATGYCMVQLFSAITNWTRSHLLIHFRTRLEARLTLRFVHHLVDLPYTYFQQHTAGDLMVRLGSNNTIREMLTSTVLSTFLDGFMAAFYLILLLLASLPLATMVIVFGVARFALMAVIRWQQRQFIAETLENQGHSQTYMVEMLAGMETLKSMGLERQAAESWANLFVDSLNISIRRGRLDAIFGVAMSLLGTVSTLALMFYGTYLVLRGTFSLGAMMAFSALAAGFLGPLSSLASSALQLQTVEIYLERLHDVMSKPPEQDDRSVAGCGSLSGGLTLEKIGFRYNSAVSLVVNDISVDIAAGQRVALVGRTGCGKSTLARIIAGLYEPITGRILFDGLDLKTLDRRTLRSQLGIVTQETQLFGGSIRKNIALADPQMRLARVIRAAKLACIHDDIVAMPLGYETPLTDRGLSLSGGQRQRLALARALANDPKILVLDEATSNLDALTEERVNRNLATLRCTRIVIAHRLSTIRDAHMILALENGRIVERGTHETLLRARGVYAELLATQREEDFRLGSQGITAC